MLKKRLERNALSQKSLCKVQVLSYNYIILQIKRKLHTKILKDLHLQNRLKLRQMDLL